MKFSEMPYQRPDLEELKQLLSGLVERLKGAASYAEAKAVFLEKDQELRHLSTLACLANVRHSIDTRTSSTTGRRPSGTAPCPSSRSTCRRGPWPCWPPPSAPTSRRSTAT